MHEHLPPPPALHRRLPNPAADHAAPALHRTSSLSRQHLFSDLAPPPLHHNHHQRQQQNGHEDTAAIARRNTVQFPQQHHPEASSPGSTADRTFRSMSVAGHHASSGCSSDRDPPPSHSREMVDEQSSQHTNSRNPSFAREHVCLCPPDPKIPRPRNCKSLFAYYFSSSNF